MTIIPLDNTELITTAQDMITRLKARLVAIERLITPTGSSQPNLMHSQVDYPYWRNRIFSNQSDTSGSPNYGEPFNRLTLDVQAMCYVGNMQAEGIEDRADLIELVGSMQFRRRPYLQSPTYPDGYAEMDVNSYDNGVYRGASQAAGDTTGGTDYIVVFRLSIPTIYENQVISEV